MVLMNTIEETKEINDLLHNDDFIKKYPKLNNINIKCEKVVNLYKKEFNEYKRTIILTTNTKLEQNLENKCCSFYDYSDDEDEEYNIEINDTYENKIIGIFTYYYGGIGKYHNIEETQYTMLLFDTEEETLEFYEDLVYNIDWKFHPKDMNS